MAGIFMTLAISGCLDGNPKFVEPPEPTAGGSEGASTTAGPTTGSMTTVGPTATSWTSGDPTTDPVDSDTLTTDATTSTTDTSSGTTSQAVCGDGAVEGGEECDNGGDNADDAACTKACKEAACGDGLIYGVVEECDDANADPADGCVACSIPISCEKVLALDPNAPSGLYTIDLDGAGPGVKLPVACDMVTAGGGWTIVERSPYDDPIASALYKNVPLNIGDPLNPKFRLPRMPMGALVDLSLEMYLGCGGSDHLIASANDLFRGEFGPQDCSNADTITFFEAELKGHKLVNVPLCVGFMGLDDGECPGAWRVDEYEQQLCGLGPFPWDFMVAVTSDGADAFAADPYVTDTMMPIHECHKPGASRVIMLR